MEAVGVTAKTEGGKEMQIFSAAACDYGRIREGSVHQDGQTLGLHSILRLEAMWQNFLDKSSCNERNILFVFSAGRPHPNYRRQCDLQAEWVRQKWRADYQSSDPPIRLLDTDEVWGTDGEIAFLKSVLQDLAKQGCTTPDVELTTEDYHFQRTQLLLQQAELHQVKLRQASSASFPPTKGELWHEWRSYVAQRFLPPILVTGMQFVSRRVRAKQYGLEMVSK